MSKTEMSKAEWIHCYKERCPMERNYSPSADAFEDTLEELRQTKELKKGDDIWNAVYLEWYYRAYAVVPEINGLDMIGEIYDDEPGGFNGIRWRRAFVTTGMLASGKVNVREHFDTWAQQRP